MIKHRRKKSCRSTGERRICEILKEYNIQFAREVTFPTCINPKTGNRLRFDFYLPEFNLLIEFQGHHHFQPVNKGRRAKWVYRETVYRDQIKKDYCLIHNFNFLDICYLDYKMIFDIIKNKITEIVGE